MLGPVLALDTSTVAGSVAVGTADELLAETVLRVAGGHSTALLPAIDAALRSAGASPADLAAVVVGSGPGSFTGLRIGAATAKGIVHALGVPLWAYSSLLAAAAGIWGAGQPVCALFDARRRDVYAACYGFGAKGQGSGQGKGGDAPDSAVETIMEPAALSLDELLEQFRGGEPPLFTGEGARLYQAEFERELRASVAPPHLALPRASALLWLWRVAPELGRVADPVAWEPEYVRASGAERIAADRAGTR